jgi:methionyl-tRNA formyltransferase
MKPFLVIVVAYGKIIPKKFLELSEKGFLNIHASLLPKWRGAAPIQRSILNKDKETGISFMKIEEKLDEGPFMKQIKVKINHQTTSLELSKKLSFLSAKNIIEAIKLIESDKAIFHNQNNDEVSYAYKIKKKEAKIIWSKSALDVISQINGLNPSPGAWFEYENSRFKIWKAEISELSGKPGRVLNDELTIACKDKSIKILEIQKEGKNKLHVNDFLSGNKIIKNKTII